MSKSLLYNLLCSLLQLHLLFCLLLLVSVASDLALGYICTPHVVSLLPSGALLVVLAEEVVMY